MPCRCATPSRCCSSSRSACCSTRCSCSRTRCRCWRSSLLIVGMKAITKFVIVTVAGYPTRVALTVAAGLAQIGEFSFIVGTRRARPRPAAGRRLPADRRRSAAVDHGQSAGAPRHRPDRGAAARDAGPREPVAAAGRGARDPRRGHAGGAAAARDRVRLRPGRPDDRARARTPRVQLHRHHPATRRGRPPAGARDPGRLR